MQPHSMLNIEIFPLDYTANAGATKSEDSIVIIRII